MDDICPKCGLPKNLCICEQIAKEQQKIKVRVDHRRFRKTVTLVGGLGKDVDIEGLAKTLKRSLACGGSVKNSGIILQGDHKRKVKELLLKQGYKEDLIDA
jgi:translation initiation factor 1